MDLGTIDGETMFIVPTAVAPQFKFIMALGGQVAATSVAFRCDHKTARQPPAHGAASITFPPRQRLAICQMSNPRNQRS